MKNQALRAVCGVLQPNNKTCVRYSCDEAGRCYHHSPHTADKRRRYASRGGTRGGKGHLSIRTARRAIRDLKRVLKYLAALTATDTLEDAIPYGNVRWHVDTTVELTKNYIKLCELEIKLGMTEDESHRTDVLDADELRESIEAQLSPPDEQDSDEISETYEAAYDPEPA